MRAALNGDDVAYRQLLEELALSFRTAVRNRLARFGRGNADIEDIVQDALLAIHLKRGTWDSTRPLAPWAHAVLQHKFSDKLRKTGNRIFETLDALPEMAADESHDRETGGDMEKLLGNLAPKHRHLVIAMSIEGRSAAEVASETGSTEGAVRVALHRALKRLAAIYRGDHS